MNTQKPQKISIRRKKKPYFFIILKYRVYHQQLLITFRQRNCMLIVAVCGMQNAEDFIRLEWLSIVFSAVDGDCGDIQCKNNNDNYS